MKVIKLGGYDGLPGRFMVESKHGWLGKDSFTTLDKARVFATEEAAIAEARRLYPFLEVTHL